MNSTKPVIIVLGPQGSGKGTQGKRLADKLGLPYLETGQLLRDEKATGSADGQYIASIIDGGGLVPADFMNHFMPAKVMAAVNAVGGVVVDSYPRNLDQSPAFDAAIKPTHVLVLELAEAESIRRLSARRVCPQDDKIYNLITDPPQQDEICDACGIKLVQRDDDTPAAIRRRLELYHNDTEPMIKAYEEQGVAVHHIDASPPIEEVWQAVEEVFPLPRERGLKL